MESWHASKASGSTCMLKYALERGNTYQRWQSLANTIIFKDKDNGRIHRTRVINIYEANYNLVLGIKWRIAYTKLRLCSSWTQDSKDPKHVATRLTRYSLKSYSSKFPEPHPKCLSKQIMMHWRALTASFRIWQWWSAKSSEYHTTQPSQMRKHSKTQSIAYARRWALLMQGTHIPTSILYTELARAVTTPPWLAGASSWAFLLIAMLPYLTTLSTVARIGQSPWASGWLDSWTMAMVILSALWMMNPRPHSQRSSINYGAMHKFGQIFLEQAEAPSNFQNVCTT